MPNWASNSLTVAGTGAQAFIDSLRIVAEGEEVDNLLSLFVPMPEELRTLHSGATTINGEHVTLWRDGPDGEPVAVSETERTNLIVRFGADNWYDWSVANWGTKWDTKADFIGDSRIVFDTAWAPPSRWLETTSLLFPEAEFTLAFSEAGMGVYGFMVVLNGEVTHVEEGQDLYEPDVDWDAYEDSGDPDFGRTPQYVEHLERYDLHSGG